MQRESHKTMRTIALSAGFFAGALAAYTLLARSASQTFGGALAQTAIAAAVALTGTALVAPHTLKTSMAATTGKRRCARLAIGIALVALGCGVARLAIHATEAGGGGIVLDGPVALRFLEVVALYALTALFEEPLFRVLLLGGLREALTWSDMRHPTCEAVVCSSLVFGLLHLGSIAGAGPTSAVTACQLVAKPLQAAAFGACMALLVVDSHSIWPAVVVHAAYDVLALGPAGVMTGALLTGYITGSWIDLILYLASGLAFFALALRWHRNGAHGAPRH